MTKHIWSICEQAVTLKQQGMFCELCEEWKHNKCDKVNNDIYKVLGDNPKETRCHWFCSECNDKAVKGIKLVLCVEKRTTKIEQEIEKVRKDVEEKMAVITDLNSELEGLKKTISNTKEEMSTAVEDHIEKTLAENQFVHTMIKDQVTSVVGEMDDGEGNPPAINEPVLEKLKEDIIRDLKQTTHTEHEATAAVNIGGTTAPEPPADWVTVMRKELSSMVNQKVETGKREKNVILYRAVEAKEEPKKKDEELVKSLLRKCEVKEGIDAVQGFKRIGAKTEGRDRPLLITFKELGQKITLFKNLKNLKTAEEPLKSVSVSHDMSQEEREISKNLVAEAKLKEQADPYHRYRVRGPPGNQRIAQLDRLGESN